MNDTAIAPYLTTPPDLTTSPAQAGNSPPPPPPVITGAVPSAPSASPLSAPAAPLSPGASTTDWASVISNIDQQKTQVATQNLTIAQQTNPEIAATAQRLSPVLGIPAATIEADPNFWQQQFDTRSSRAAMDTDSNLKTWMASDLNNAKAAQGDVPQLGFIGGLWDGLKQGWQAQGIQSQLGYMGATEGAAGLSPQQQDLGQTLKEQLAALTPAPQGAGGAIGSFLGSTTRMIGAATPEAAAGAASGAVLGLPEGGVGAIPGAIAGAARGLALGIAGQQGVQSYGQTYDTLADTTDKFGNPIPETTRQAASMLAGVGSAALAMVGGETLSAPAKALAGSLLSKVAIEAAARPTLSRAFSTFATSAVKAGVTGALVNGGMTAIQTVMPDLAKTITSPNFATVFNDPANQDVLVKSTVDSMEQGALAFPLAEMPMHGVALWSDLVRANAATQSVKAWGALQDAAASSKTRQRSPDMFSNLMAMHADDGNVESVFVPGARMSEMYQSLDVKPGDAADPFHFVPDMAEQLQRAELTGGDVEIPTAQFTANLAGSSIEKTLRPDIRFAPDGMTMQEALDLQAQHPGLEADGESLANGFEQHLADVQKTQDERDSIHTQMNQQLRGAGFTPDVANQYATLAAERYLTRGERLGTSPLELYNDEGLQVRRETQRLGQGNYDSIDELIDNLRNNTKQPTDKQIYGDSLLEHIAKRGGIADPGGDLKAMGADKWHVGKPGQRKLVTPDGQNADDVTQDAWQHDAFAGPHDGYFPDHPERPSIQDLHDAIGRELRGQKVYRTPDAAALKLVEKRDALRELDQFLNEHGLDVKTASNDEIKTAISNTSGEQHFEQVAYHGSPRTFDRFTTDHIGTGEGAQNYGHGLYFSSKREIANFYKGESGRLYHAEIPEDDHFLDWSKSFSDQPEPVKTALQSLGHADGDTRTGEQIYDDLHSDPKQASDMLRESGVAGIKYPSGGSSRYARETPPNYVLFSGDKADIREYEQRDVARQTETPEFKNWFGDSKVVDGDGKPQVVYHGTARPDRVGERFQSKRATSGPMAFFTDNPDIASKYSTSKPDTSLARDDSNYETWFRVKVPGARAAVNIDRAWHYLSHEERTKISELAPRVSVDDETGENIELREPGHNRGLGGYDQDLKESKGNALKALVESWLNGGNLFNDEQRFEQVLKLAGLDRPVEYHDPNAQNSAVYPVHLKIANPLDTSEIPQGLVNDLAAAAAKKRFNPNNTGGDMWDKSRRDPKEWMRNLLDDIETQKNSSAWTSIPDWVTDVLKQHGYDGIKDTGGKNSGQAHAVWIPFDDKQIKSATANRGTFDPNDANILRQGIEGTIARGSITMAEGRRIIRLFRDADLSTLLHEFGHQWLDELFRDASREDAPPSLRDDAATVRKALGLADGQMPDVIHHEAWARMFETYLMTGDAPSSELRLAFQKFAAWMTRIYRTIAGIGAPVSDDIKDVMDRLLATDDAIAEARDGLAMRNPVFRSAEDAGMTAGQFAAYTHMIRNASQSAYDRTLNRAMRAERAKATATFKAAAAEARPGVEAQVKSRPVLRAWNYLAKGRDPIDPDRPMLEAKMDSAAVHEILGEGTKRLPAGLTEQNGTHPDIIALMFGYGTGEDMLRDLVNENMGRREAEAQSGKSISLDRWISRLTDQAVNDKVIASHGDPLLDGTIEETARAAAHNAAQIDVFATEIRQLAKLNGAEPPFSVQEAQRWVKSQTAEMPIRKATLVKGFQRAEAQAGRDAERALLSKRPVDAFKAKQRQMLAHLMATEAQRLSDTFDRTVKSWRDLAKSPTRKGTAQEFMDQAHSILARLGANVRRDPGELARGLQRRPLDRFIEDKSADGYDLQVPDFLQNPNFQKFYGDLTSDQFEAARDAITSLLTAGRAQEEVTLAGQRMALDDVVNEAVDRILESPGLKISDRVRPERARDVEGVMTLMASGLRSVDASLLKMEQLFSDMDGEHGTGPFLKMFDRLKGAQHDENDRLADIAALWRNLKSQLPDDWAKGLRTEYTISELRDKDTGKPARMTRDELLGMALNVGNQGPTSNFEKLTRGMGWDGDAVMSVLRQRLTKADWDFVQHVWDIFSSMTPDIEAMHRRVTGIGFPRVEATPIETPHGSYRGGYFPIIYDATKAPTARASETADGVLGRNYFKATTSKGHTMSRVEYNAPLRLGLDQIPYKLSQVVHDLTHREAIMDAWKLLNHPDITSAVRTHIGPEYAKLFNPWLRDLANNSNTDDKALGWMDSAIQRARLGASAVGIGFRVSTVLKHGLSALSNSIGEVGGKELALASRDIYGPNGAKQRAYIMERSGELRHRMESIDRDARESLKSLMGEDSWIQQVQRLGYYPVAALDMGSAMPTWLAGYRKALLAGMDDAEAVAEADRVVRFAHGSSGAADLAAIQRGNEFVKSLAMFYSFFNHMYNRERAGVQLARRGVAKIQRGDTAGARRDFVAVAGRSLYYLMIPALIEALVSGNRGTQGDNWVERGALAILNQAAGGIPILRDIASSAIEGYPLEVSPLEHVVAESGETAKDIARATGLSDKPVSDHWLQHAIDTTGYATGLPLGQAGTAAQYFWDIGDGVADPQSAGDFLMGLMHGTPPHRQ